MELDDQITITMPEGGELQLQLAGLGSRFIAGSADLIIQLLAVVVLTLVTGVVSGGRRLDQVVFVVGVFVLWFGYPIAFELLARGRTPGKRLTLLRVVREHGEAVDLQASAIRNLMRLLDGPALLYAPTVISILATKRNQRPGDLAAGTLVVREPSTGGKRRQTPTVVAMSIPVAELHWDVSGVSAEETAAVRRFLERRETLAPEARTALGDRLADALAEKVAGAQREMTAEQFLQALVDLKSNA